MNKFKVDTQAEFDIKQEIFKYLFYWKFFAISVILCLVIAFLSNRYADKIYQTSAKIKIIDKNQSSIDLTSVDGLFSKSKINLENEIAIIKSSQIISKVIDNLGLQINIYDVGNVKNSLAINYPFKIISNLSKSEMFPSSYRITFIEKGFEILNLGNNNLIGFEGNSTYKNNHNLPFEIYDIDLKKILSDKSKYDVFISDEKSKIFELQNSLIIQPVGKRSDIIELKYNSSNSNYSEKILNEIINVFNNDGVKDRQLVHKRTIDFVNSRFDFLTLELDSIEVEKKIFKIENNLVDFSVSSEISISQSFKSEVDIFSIENQISITKFLIESIDNSNTDLLPSNIGVENFEINSLISNYNKTILDRKKLITSAGSNNPSIKQMDVFINDYRKNIIFSLKNYLTQLNLSKNNFSNQYYKYGNEVSNLPEKEKLLRSIERNQEIKEALYLFLLQKREEAEVNYAVTEPSIKVVEYAISEKNPIYPEKTLSYLRYIFFGFLFPFIIIYLKYFFDNKIHTIDDIKIVNPSFSILGEIPFFEDMSDNEKIISEASDRSIVAESFRMLISNARYLENNEKKCNVFIVTSSIKGEGKTLAAINLSLCLATLDKKVLLIGCDLRNPQIHRYINYDKNTNGTADYLFNNKVNWKDFVLNPLENFSSFNILLSGPIAPNPLNLINNGNLEKLVLEAKKDYDYVIIDTAPTLLVPDTKSIFKLSDAVVFMTRSGVTDKEILSHIEKLTNDINPNLGVVLNGAGRKSPYAYSYGYRYGYNYKYSYNYGYGYGYSEDS